jgi:hypothetical protein
MLKARVGIPRLRVSYIDFQNDLNEFLEKLPYWERIQVFNNEDITRAMESFV